MWGTIGQHTMLLVSHHIAVCSYAVTFVDIQNAIGGNVVGAEVCKQMGLFVEGGELQASKRFPCTRDETIENVFALIGRSWNHEVINLLEHRVWCDQGNASQIFPIKPQICMQPSCDKGYGFIISQHQVEAILAAETAVDAGGNITNEGSRMAASGKMCEQTFPYRQTEVRPGWVIDQR